jgi:hypothetical protein
MDYSELKKTVEGGHFHKIPKDCLTYEVLSQEDENGTNLVQTAIYSGQIKKAPPEFLTKELIVDTGCLHTAAASRRLGDLPSKYLTKEYLSTKDYLGNTVYHIAAGCWDLKAIPASELDEEVVLTKNNKGKTPLDNAFFPYGGDEIQQAPILLKVLSDKTLEKLSKKYSRAWPKKEHGSRRAHVTDELEIREELKRLEERQREIKKRVKKCITEEEITI